MRDVVDFLFSRARARKKREERRRRKRERERAKRIYPAREKEKRESKNPGSSLVRPRGARLCVCFV